MPLKSSFKRVARAAVLLAVLAATSVMAQSDSGSAGLANWSVREQASSERAATRLQDYVISPEDVLEVSILDVPEISRQYRVSPLGTVKLPLLSQPLPAAGLSLEQFSDKLAEELKSAGLVSNPQVTTSVKESRVHSVAVAGAVKRPQIYPVLGRTTLLDVLSQAEGVTDDAGSTAVIQRGHIGQAALRKADAVTTEAAPTERVDIEQLLEGGDPKLNIDIYPGDRITVPRAGFIYVVGAVNQPGGYPANASKQGTTVLQAVALAKDIKPTSIPSKSMIIRIDPQGSQGRTQIPVDLKKVLAGKSPDLVLEAEDILFIPDSNSKKAFRRGVESILQVATGLAMYGRY